MADRNAYQNYTVGQVVTGRVLAVREADVLIAIEDSAPGVLALARLINFGVAPVRFALPGDVLPLTVSGLDHDQQRVILTVDETYEALAKRANLDTIAAETRRVMALLAPGDDDDDDLFADFDSRLRVHGSHSEPHVLEEDFDNFGETLYQLIDEKDDKHDDDEDE